MKFDEIIIDWTKLYERMWTYVCKIKQIYKSAVSANFCELTELN